MRIRILHIIDTLLGMGGLEKGVVNLINRMDPSRFDHVVCVLRSLGTLADSIPADRGRVICLGDNGSGRRFQAPAIGAQIQALRPDIVHSRNWGTIESVFAARCVGCPAVIHSEHGIESKSPDEPVRRRVLRRLAFQFADRVLTVSHHLRDHHSRITGFPAQKILVIHNGVDTDLFRSRPQDRMRIRPRYGLAADEFCIGTVGRLEPIKDLFTLLRAATAFPASLNWRILLAGDGSELLGLQQYVRNRPELCRRIMFVGEIDQVPDYLNALDVYVLPSLREGLSNSLLEAMSSGLAVVASDVAGNSEVVAHGESGVLFPVGDSDALAQLLLGLRNPEARREMGIQARRRVVESFSLDSMAREYTRMYNSVIA